MSKPPKNQTRLVELAYNRSSDRLQQQATVANFADQRSLILATLSIASAALVFGTLIGTENKNIAVGSAIFFCLAAALSVAAAMPGKLFTSGSKAGEIRDAIDGNTEYTSALLGLCENNDGYIDKNECAAATRAHMYRFSIILFFVGVVISLIGFCSQ